MTEWPRKYTVARWIARVIVALAFAGIAYVIVWALNRVWTIHPAALAAALMFGFMMHRQVYANLPDKGDIRKHLAERNQSWKN